MFLFLSIARRQPRQHPVPTSTASRARSVGIRDWPEALWVVGLLVIVVAATRLCPAAAGRRRTCGSPTWSSTASTRRCGRSSPRSSAPCGLVIYLPGPVRADHAHERPLAEPHAAKPSPTPKTSAAGCACRGSTSSAAPSSRSISGRVIRGPLDASCALGRDPVLNLPRRLQLWLARQLRQHRRGRGSRPPFIRLRLHGRRHHAC